MKPEPLQYRSESPVQGMFDRQQESRGFNPVRKSSLDRSECFRGKREKEKFREKKNREASTAGGCMLKTPKPI